MRTAATLVGCLLSAACAGHGASAVPAGAAASAQDERCATMGDAPATSGLARHTPPGPAVLGERIVLELEVGEGKAVGRVDLVIKPSDVRWHDTLPMTRHGGAFRAELSCPEVFRTAKDVRYYFVLRGAGGERVDQLGSPTRPFRVLVAPAPPGAKVPAGCGLPAPPRHPDGAPCERDEECKEGLVCLRDTCQEPGEGCP